MYTPRVIPPVVLLGLLFAVWTVVRLPSDAVIGARHVVAAGGGACALFDDGPMRCWGATPFTPYGEGSFIPEIRRPQAYANVATRPRARDIAASCALTAEDALECDIGWSADGKRCPPLRSAPELHEIRSVRADGRVCAIARRDDEPAAVWCHALRSNHDCAPLSSEWEKVDEGEPVAIAVGGLDVCALQRSGRVRCNGSEIAGVERALQIAAGDGFACARDERGTVRCWGENRDGELGDGTTIGHADARTIAWQGAASELQALGRRACIIADGRPFCWGELYPAHRALPRRVTLVPQQVAEVSDLTSLAVGYGFVCATRRDTSITCWGHDADGALGDGTLLPHAGCHREGIGGTSVERERPGGPSIVRTGEAGELPRARVPLVLAIILLLVTPSALAIAATRRARLRHRRLLVGAALLFGLWVPAAVVRVGLAVLATYDRACRGQDCSLTARDWSEYAMPLLGPIVALFVVAGVFAWLLGADDSKLARGGRACARWIAGVAVPAVLVTMFATLRGGMNDRARDAVVYALRNANLSLEPLYTARFLWTVAWLIFALAYACFLGAARDPASRKLV